MPFASEWLDHALRPKIAVRPDEGVTRKTGEAAHSLPSNIIMASLLLRGAASVLRYACPPFSERRIFTVTTLPLLIVKLLPVLLAAHIRLRYSQTPLIIKLLVILLAAPLISHFCFCYYFFLCWHTFDGVPVTISFLSVVNDGMQAMALILKLLELLFLGNDGDYEVMHAKEHRSIVGKETDQYYSYERPSKYPGTSAWLEWDMINNLRGAGYAWGIRTPHAGYKAVKSCQQLKEKGVNEASRRKWQLVKQTMQNALLSWTVIDIGDSILKSSYVFPSNSALGARLLHDASLGRLGWIGSYAVTLITGILVVAGFQAFFSTFYLVALLTTAASEIPITSSRWLPSPLNHPYFCTSIASFWSKGWHTNFRRPFMLFAYLPMLRFSNLVGLLKRAGRVLAIVATFALSGLLHELILSGQVSPFYQHDLHVRYGHTYLGDQSEAVQGQYGMGTNNYGTTYAFAIQGVFVVLEDLWLNCIETKVVKLLAGGRKEQSGQGHIITGLWRSALGWLWMMGCMMYSGSILVNIWLMHGSFNYFLSFRWTARFFSLARSYLFA